jgi:hypothetical protein
MMRRSRKRDGGSSGNDQLEENYAIGSEELQRKET